MRSVKVVVQVKLLPTPEQAAALEATLRACNEAAAWASGQAYERRVFGRAPLQQLVYADLRARGLSAQPSLHVVRKVADAYTTLHAQVKAGLLRHEDSPRRVKVLAKPIEFRADAAQPFDDRCLSWQMDARTVSIWTVTRRMKNVAFTGAAGQLKMLAEYRQGETDLVCRGGKWFLIATCEVPERPMNTDPRGFVGVDRGIVNLATTSDGNNHQGEKLRGYRKRMARVRTELQAKGTKSTKRKLKQRSRRGARHASHTNHKIAKEIVAEAGGTSRAEGYGGALVAVSPWRTWAGSASGYGSGGPSGPRSPTGRSTSSASTSPTRHGGAGCPSWWWTRPYTSQTCPRCGHVDKRNRPCRDWFCCVVCGLSPSYRWEVPPGPADHIAAVNVRQRAQVAWAFVNRPDAAVSPTCRRGQSRAANPKPKHRATKPIASATGR